MAHKRNVVLYLDAELVKKTKELGFNLSKTFENHLKQLITMFQNFNTANNCETSVIVGSLGEIRTLVSGSRAEKTSLNQPSFVVKDVDWVVSDFWQYCKIEERLSDKVSKDYKNVARRLLSSSDGEISRQSIRESLEPYLQKKPKTYNNVVDALRAGEERI